MLVALHNQRAHFGVPLGIAGSGLVVGVALAPHPFRVGRVRTSVSNVEPSQPWA